MAIKILFIHGHMVHQRTWRRVAELLRPEGVELKLRPQWQTEEIVKELSESPPSALFCELFRDLPGFEQILEATGETPVRAGLNSEIPEAFNTLSASHQTRLKAYLHTLSLENYHQAIRFLSSLSGHGLEYKDPVEVRTHGIFHPNAESYFFDQAEYLTWLQEEFGSEPDRNLVGLLCYRNQLVEGNAAEIEAAILALQSHGLIPMCIFCEGMLDSSLPLAERYPWLEYLRHQKNDLICLLNLLAGRFLSKADEAPLLSELGVPVLQGIRLHAKTRTDWQKDPMGIANHSLVYSIAQPETAGAIEPTLLATDEFDETGPSPERCFQPHPERMELLCRRIIRWQKLRNTPHPQKRVTIVLHNNPCKGVEATVGMAVGLDALASLGRVVAALRAKGYDVGDAPEDGAEILRLIQEKKAHAEFRWTTADEILRKGGDLHRMTAAEYLPYFERLPQKAREKLLSDWDEFPGEGMVWADENGRQHLIITGLEFGNLKIITQPKRGCYGPKCTGEVCRILHDPELSPPHHWLATYKYIRDTSDVVIHFGAEGALEYLPGKRAVLSDACFPEISLGDLPNLYVYAMDIPGEGLTAKRRGRAVMIDHLPPVYKPMQLGGDAALLADLLEQYQHAAQMGESSRMQKLLPKMRPLLEKLKLADQKDQDLEQSLELVQRRLAAMKSALVPEGLHVLGQAPGRRMASLYLAMLLKKGGREQPTLPELAGYCPSPSGDEFQDAADYLDTLLAGGDDINTGSDFKNWCLDKKQKLDLAEQEIGQLLKALDGAYIEPNLGGSLLMGQDQALPSGRNFYAIDVLRLPSEAAWETGRELADSLLAKYLEDEGCFPQSVGISLWSSDAFKSHGEVLCQILHLMGAKPVWESNGRVRRVEAIPPEELSLKAGGNLMPRPRVDVVVQTSGILRDMVPGFIDLIDLAAVMLGDLDEPEDLNFIRKHTRERMAELDAELGGDEIDLKRLASFRVFSSAPGTFGLGVELALDASAWGDQNDLAETYVNWGGYAYGAGERQRGGKPTPSSPAASRIWTCPTCASFRRSTIWLTAAATRHFRAAWPLRPGQWEARGRVAISGEAWAVVNPGQVN